MTLSTSRRLSALATALFVVTLSLTGAGVAPPAGAAVPNSPPQAVDDVVSTPMDTADTAVSIDVLANDTDADGDVLSIDASPYPYGTSNGIVDLDVATGRLLYTANNGFVGPETFTYDVTDGMTTSTATVRVFVGFHSNINLDFTVGAPGQISRSAVLGVPTTYIIHAANASSFPAHDVTITNSVPSNFEITAISDPHCSPTGNDITCTWNVLEPYDPAINNSVDITVDLNPVAAGLFTNSMTVTSLEDDPAQPPPTADYTSSVYQSGGTADLGALAYGPPSASSLGDHVVMSFNGQNYGPSAATNAVLTDTIPANFRIDSVSNPADCAVAGNTVTCQRPTLSGFFETAVFLTAVLPGSWSNSATITSATPEAAPEYAANTWSTSGTVAGLAFTSADHATFTVATPGTFTVTVAGQGRPALSATGQLPQGLSFLDNGDGTATVAGTPNVGSTGSYPLTITASNGIDSDVTQSFTATVNPVAPIFVTSVTPSTRAVGLTNQIFDIRGGGFVSGASVIVTGVPNANQTTVFVDSTRLTLTISRIPAWAATGPHDVTVANPGAGGLRATCAGCLVLNPWPTVTSVAPAALPQGATANVVLTGTGFATGAMVSFGSGVTVNAPPSVGAGGSRLTVNVTISANAGVGSRAVKVTNTDGGSVSRAVFRVNAAPVISAITPNALAQGVVRNVVITGAGFATPSPAVFFGPGVSVGTVVRNSASKLTVSVAVDPGAAIGGSHDVVVTNLDGGAATCVACFSVNPAPTITSVSPSTVRRGTSRALTITGTGFQSNIVLALSPAAGVTLKNIVVVSPTTITCTITVAANTLVGNRTLTVTNRDGGMAQKAITILL